MKINYSQTLTVGLLGAEVEIANPMTTHGIIPQMLEAARLAEIERRILAIEAAMREDK